MAVGQDKPTESRAERVRVRTRRRRRPSMMRRLRRSVMRGAGRLVRRATRIGRSAGSYIGGPIRPLEALPIPEDLDGLPSPLRLSLARINWRFLGILALVLVLTVGSLGAGHWFFHRCAADRALAAGDAAWRAKAWQEASRQWRVYLEKHPDNLDVLLRYAKANLEIRPQGPKELGAALGAYTQYLHLKPGDAEASSRICHLFASVRNYKMVAEYARKRLAVAPNDVPAVISLGRALLALDKRDEATELLTKFVKVHPAEVEPYTILSDMALLRTSDVAQAESLEWLDRAIRNNPTSAEALARRARFHQKVKPDAQAARADLEAAERLKPDDLKSLLLLAEGWFDAGELELASEKLDVIRRFEQDLPPDGEVNLRNLALGVFVAEGNLMLRQGRKEEGVRLADRALDKLVGMRREVFLPLGVDLYLAAGRIDIARRLVDEYQVSVLARSKPEESVLNQLALLQAGLAGAENQPNRVINLIEPLVVGKTVGVPIVGGAESVQVWRLLARAYSMTGQDRRALEALDRYVLRRPNDAEAVLELGQAYYRQGNFARAVEYAAAAERLRPDSLQAKLLSIMASNRQASRVATQPFVSPTFAKLQALRDAHPSEVEIRIMIAKMAVADGRPADAIAELERATRECDRALPAWLELAAIQDNQGRLPQAADACREAIARFPDVASPWTLRADVFSRMSRPDEARAVLEEAGRKLAGSERAAARFALAKFLLKHDRRRDGLDRLRTIAAEAPDDERCRLELLRQSEIQADAARAQSLVDDLHRIEGDWGLRWQLAQAELWLRQKDWRERSPQILKKLQKCIENDPSWPDPVVVLGQMYEQCGQVDKAEEVYHRFFTNNPKPTEVLIRLFDLLERQRRYIAAGKLLDKINDKYPFLGALRIKAAIGRGDYDTAIRDLRERIGADPDDAVARVVLARLVYHRHHDAGLALKLLDEAYAVNPNLLLGMTTRVAILRDEKRLVEAKAFLDGEVDRRKDFEAYAVRAQYLSDNGQDGPAEQDYRRLTTFPGFAADGYQRLGEFYWKTNRGDQAVAAWKAGLKIQPDDLRLSQTLIKTLLASEEPAKRQEGQQMLDDRLRRLPDEPSLLSLKAALLLSDERPEAAQEAVQVLERVVQLNPRDIVAHLHLMEQARQWGDFHVERKFADRALGANPENPALLSAKASLERRLGNVRVSWQLALSAIRLDPENVTARILLVYLGLRTGRYDEALKYAREALQLDAANEEVNLVCALALAAQNHRGEAIKQLESYRKPRSDRPSIRGLLLLADLYRFEGDIDAAEARVSEAEALDPSQPAVFTARLRCLASRKQFDEVLTRFSQRRISHLAEPQVALAVASIMAYAGQDRYLREARTLYEDLNRTNPDEVAGYLGLGQVANELGEVGVAIQAYRQVVKIDPFHQQGLNNLAWLLAVNTDKLDEAYELADRGVLRYHDDANLYNTRGTVLLKQHQPARARADYERSLRMLPTPSAARAKGLVDLGRACLQLGDLSTASRSFAEALQIDTSLVVLSDTERAEVRELLKSARGPSTGTAPASAPVSAPASKKRPVR